MPDRRPVYLLAPPMVAFFEWLVGRHTCECGTVYQVTTTRTPVPNTDVAVCEHCGGVMDTWRQSKVVRAYDVVTPSDW